MKRFLLIPLLVLSTMVSSTAQETSIFDDANEYHKKATSLYQDHSYGPAQVYFQKAIDLTQPVNQPKYQKLQRDAELHFALCSIRMELEEGETQVLDFIRRYYPDPSTVDALIEIGNYYYNDKDYVKAIEYFSRLNNSDLSNSRLSEVRFKTGYAYFTKKKFDQALVNFRQVKEIKNEYYYPTNYYYGMSMFFKGDYDATIASFKRVEESDVYQPHIPYYLAQIYLEQKDFDGLIAYINNALQTPNLKKKGELHRILAQAYFENERYEEAVPHFAEYEASAKTIRKEEVYQMGYASYITGDCDNAIRNFKQLRKIKDAIGQSAMYYQGDCHIKQGDKVSARTAFNNAAQLDFDPMIQRESNFNFAKLSYELNYDKDALNALRDIPQTDPNYAEAQELMGSIFTNTRDYAASIRALESMPSRSPSMETAYEEVTHYRGLQLLSEDHPFEAQRYFKKSLSISQNESITAQNYFWLGETQHTAKDYQNSINSINNFIKRAAYVSNLPPQTGVHTAHYIQGYNFLKRNQFQKALKSFESSIQKINSRKGYSSDDYVYNTVYNDAQLRAGDCEFKLGRYANAVNYYNTSTQGGDSDQSYALYQTALIQGLQGNRRAQTESLNEIITDYPQSEYVDDAFLMLAESYQGMNQYERALSTLKSFTNAYPNSNLKNSALMQMGLISYNQGDNDGAIRYYKGVLNNSPNKKEAENAMSALREIYVDDMGQADEYVNTIESIPGINLDNMAKDSLNYSAAMVRYENANYNEAINAFSNYLGKYPRGLYQYDAYYYRGDSYLTQERYDKAVNDFEKVINSRENKFTSKASEKAAIIAYNHFKDFKKAYQYYSSLESSTTDIDLRHKAQLGAMRSAYRIKDTRGTMNMAQKVIQNPRSNKIEMASAHFYIGKIHFDNRSFADALEQFNKVTRMSDNEQTAEARYLIANIYYENGEFDLAEQLCMNSNKESANYQYWVAKSVILLSDCYAVRGDTFNAMAALEALIEGYTGDQALINEAQIKLNKLKVKNDAESKLLVPQNPGKLELEEGGK